MPFPNRHWNNPPLAPPRRGLAAAEAIVIPFLALMVSMVVFSFFLLAIRADLGGVYYSIYRAAFGSWFSWQNTLVRAAPLMLTALCTALPAYLGLVIIGGEGAFVIGGLAAALVGLVLIAQTPWIVLIGMALAGMTVGGLWIAFCGALRHYRGVNETISSLLLNYIAIAVASHLFSGPFRDPRSLNKPSTSPIGEESMLGVIPGSNIHWGLIFGVATCLLCWFLMHKTTFGFAARITGGNVKAALLSGLPVGRLIVLVCFFAGAGGGLAGMIEVAAVHGSANSSLNANYGYTGILVAFVARHNPIAIIPVAILLGGIRSSSGLLQRAQDLPDATVLVLQGIVFVVILFSETLYGRFRIFQQNGVPPHR